jgi:hypothetical protein
MPEPATSSRRPRIPSSLPTCPKTNPTPSATPRRLLCRETQPYRRKVSWQQALFARILDIKIWRKIFNSKLRLC